MSRLIFPLLLALSMAMTSQSMAVARGAAAATGQMVICTGSGTMTVFTDADGVPTGAPYICPDCVAGVIFSAVQAVVKPPARVVTGPLALRVALPVRVAGLRIMPPVRGPPVAV